MKLWPYLALARPHHWPKNVFVLPGLLLAVFFDRTLLHRGALYGVLAGLAAVCLVASANYVLNEILDAPTDRHHPGKHRRPCASRTCPMSMS